MFGCWIGDLCDMLCVTFGKQTFLTHVRAMVDDRVNESMCLDMLGLQFYILRNNKKYHV